MKLPLSLRNPTCPRTKSRKRKLAARRFHLQFEQLEDRRLLAIVNWIGGSGDWNTTTNWQDDAVPPVNRLPGADDDAVINVAPSNTVTHSTLTHTVQSLTTNAPFTLSGGTLIVTGNLVQQNASAFTMTGGKLGSATVVGGGGAVLAVAGFGTFDGVTLGANVGGVPTAVAVQGNSGVFTVTGGLTFANGSLVDLGNQMTLNGDQTLGGAGEIRFRAGAALVANTGQTTFGPGLTIHRSDANFSNISIGNGASILNRGTILADAGGTIRVLGNLGSAFFTNAAGGVLAADGGTLWLGADWSNAGQIVVNNSTLNLDGGYTTDRIGSITRTGGTINLRGLLDNTGSILALDATTGSWNLGVGGRLRRGALVTSGGAVLAVLPGAPGTLDGLTLGATVAGVPVSATVQGTGEFTVTGGLTFANGSLVDLGSGMFLDGDQTLGGDGEIRFRGTGGISNTHQTTFAAGLTIHRDDIASSDINIISGSITNQGTIRTDVGGGEIRVTGSNPGTSLTNAVGGVLSADGGTLSLLTSWSNAGQIVVNNSTLNLGGSFTTAGIGSITRTGGTINLTGLLDNTGRTLSLDAATGSWNLGPSGNGRLRGGSLVTSGGAVLMAAGGTLDGVTLGHTPVGGVPASATVQGNGSAGFNVTGGLTFANGSLVDLGNSMFLNGDQTLGGDGEIRFRAGGGITNYSQTTFGTGLTIHRSDTARSDIHMVGGSITNRATIRADAGGEIRVTIGSAATFTNAANGLLAAAGGTLTIAPGVIGFSWTNIGRLAVFNNSTLTLGGAWSNTGVIQVTGGTLNLGGSFTGIGTLTNDMGGVVNLTGTLDNTGRTLALDASTGSLILRGGTIVGGRVSTADSAELVAGLPVGTLDGVTLAATITGIRMAVTGGLTLEQGLIDVGQVDVNGTQTLGGTGTIVFSTNDPENDLQVSTDATLTIGPGVTIHGVTGTIGKNLGVRIVNQGTIAADGGGTLTVQGISNIASGTLTGGTWQVSGNSTLRLIGANISTNAADILVDGANARLFSDIFSTNALAGLAANTAAGRLRLENGASLTTSAGNVDNQGSLTVGAGSTFVASTVTVAQAGTLAGSGTVAGNLVNNGQVRPGTSPGSLSVNGNYTQGATGRLDIELGGTTAGSQYDRLSVSGSATLNGTLDVRLVNGFGPATGQLFEVMTFAGHTGTFSTVNGLSQGRFPLFSLAVNPANVVLNAVANGTDLAFDAFRSGTIPPNAMPGQNVSLTYNVRNLSDPPAVGNWTDSVYLSRDGVLDPSDTLLTRVEHLGGVAGLGSYTATATAPLPALIDANYRVIVVADSRGLVSDADRGNNRGVSAQAISVTVPLLTLGTPVNGTIAPGQDLYYRVLVAPGRDVTVAADFAVQPGAEVAVRYAALPDPTNRDDAAAAGKLQSRLVLSNTQGGTYYIRLHGREDAAGSVAFTLTAAASAFEIMSVLPLNATNQTTTPASITLQGARFTPQTLVQLRQAGGPTRAAQTVEFISANELVARVDLVGLPIGTYEVVAQDAGQTAVAFDAFTVTDTRKEGNFIWIQSRAFVRVGAVIELIVGFNNQALPTPLLQIRATDVEPEETTNSLYLEGFGILDPFKRYGTHPKNPGTSTFELSIIEQSQTPMDWDTQKAALRPETIPPDAWDAVWDNLRPQLGETLSDFLEFLKITKLKLREASGELIQDLERLFSFELARANNTPAVPVPATAVDVAFPAPGLPLVFGRSQGDTISGRYRLGRLGRGWTDNFDISISDDAMTGTATLKQGGIVRFFGLMPDGSYESVAGDFGVLSKVNGAFQLREATGDVTAFHADGLLDFLQDANGNRITAGYPDAQLTSLTHTSGAALTLAYNGQGRIRQVTDPAGGVTAYEYDASGEHLIRVTTTAGTTEYAYAANLTGARAHALASITFIDGTHLFFDYDSQGRLVRQQGDGGAGTLRFAYDTASFSVTDAQDQVTTLFHDDSFRIRKIRDPLGRLSYTDYDDAANKPAIIGAVGGGEANLLYDALGNPGFVQNPIGEAQAFTYEPGHSRLANWEDALGHDTQFNHDANGNLLTTTHADGSTEQYIYNAQGNVVGAVNRLGQIIQYSYNSRGQVTRKDLPNGTRVDFTYNARGNPETVVDASGTMRLEYLDAQNPDLLTKITYPTGRFLEYTYQNGRRTRMADQSGFAVNYLYDAVGRLDVLRDGSGGVIVDYDYDPLGRLARETRGNFTVTLYAYDNAGQLLDITHRAADATIQSQFIYAYDHLGRRTSVTTLQGMTTYGYDGAGRLTEVTLPNGRVLTYAYDAEGNRTVAGDNGASTTYTVNDLNQYVAFGSTSQAFDAAGNLVSSSSPSGSASYLYDAEGRLVSQITPAGTWTYEFDVLGNRIASTLNGVRTEYLVDPFGLGDVVGEYDGAGNLQAHYVHGLGLTSRVDVAGPAAFYQFDAVGNTTQLTGAGGAVLNSYSYLPFGESLGTSETVANPFEYVGQFGVMREGSGLDYMRNRWYAATQGRFTQEDPIGLAGGTNLFSYVSNNPVSFADPAGLDSTLVDVAIFGNTLLAGSRYIGLAYAPTLVGDTTGALAAQTANWVASKAAGPVSQSGLSAWRTWAAASRAVERPIATVGQVQRAVMWARVARLPASGPAHVIAGVAGAVGLLSIIHSLGSGIYFAATGNELGCLPGIPASIQVCNPAIDGIFGSNIQTLSVQRVNVSRDPNDIVGPAGFGADGFTVPQATLPYLINFQNLPAADGPAAEVIVTHVLDADLDLDTFELDEFSFGGISVPVPAGRQVYSTRLDLRSTRGVFVDVVAGLDRVTRTVTWRLQAIDPLTLDLPISPFVGFLPPDKVAPEGQGFVSFSARAKPDLPTGTRIDAQARIVIDTNDPIDTNIWITTLDDGPPTSSVDPLPGVTRTAEFHVSWSGADDSGGSGIASYDIFVSDNGGPATLWQDDITATSAVFTGVHGHTYAFYSLAADNVGHRQSTPTMAQATTTLIHHEPQLAPIDADDALVVAESTGPLAGATPVEFPLSATDLDTAQTLTFSLGVASADESACSAAMVYDPNTPADAILLEVTVPSQVATPGMTLADSSTATGVLRIKAGPDSAGDWCFRVVVSDGSGESTIRTLRLTVTPTNSGPIDLELSNSSVPENSPSGTLVGTLSTLDIPAQDTHTYELLVDAGGRFQLVGNQIQVAIGSLLDFESGTSHMIQVRTTNLAGASLTKDLTIGVLSVNEPPVLVNPGNKVLDEKTALSFTLNAVDVDVVAGAADTVSYSMVSGNLIGMTLGGTTGLISWTPTEAQDGQHVVVFRATDNHNLAGADQTVTIAVNEINDPPVLASPGDRSVDELQLLSFTLLAEDVDVVAGIPDSITYSIVSGNQPGMTLLATSGAFTWTPTDTQAGQYVVRFRATDNHQAAHEQAVTITVNEIHHAPTDIGLSANTVAENAANGTVVGTLSAVDPDTGDSHTYTLTDDAGGRFAVVDDKLVVANGALLDFEIQRSHQVTIRATDGAGLKMEKTFTIDLTNVFELQNIDVQKGAVQRSYIRSIDLVFDDAPALQDLIAAGRIQLMRFDLNGNNGTSVNLAGKVTQQGTTLALDFGLQGIGGNRNNNVGDGYYQFKLDVDGNGSFESTRSFYRLFGDANGDRQVNDADLAAIAAVMGNIGTNLNEDINGDGRVNSLDSLYARSAKDRRLRDGLFVDD